MTATQGTEDKARAASRRRWPGWLSPAAAAGVLLLVGGLLVLLRSTSHGSPAPPPGAARVASPDYYVALSGGTTAGWYAYAPLSGSGPLVKPNDLVVGSTAGGKKLATVRPPSSMTFALVTGAADDRTFVAGAAQLPKVTSGNPSSAGTGNTWYEVRLTPGSAHVATLSKLRIPATPQATGVALSPDGSTLAVSIAFPKGLQELRLYSVTSGALLHTWSTQSGRVTSAPNPLSLAIYTDAGTTLRWADAQHLAFVLRTPGDGSGGYGAIRVLDTTAGGPNLMTDSKQVLGLTPTYVAGTGEGPADAYACHPELGWSLLANRTTVLCAAVGGTSNALKGSGLQPASDCAAKTNVRLGFVSWPPAGPVSLSGGGVEISIFGGEVYAVKTSCLTATSTVALGWASPDGSQVVGYFRTSGHAEFGSYAGGRWVQLPAPPVDLSNSANTAAW